MLIPPREMALVVRQIASTFEGRIRPHLPGNEAAEDADHIVRLLAMLSVALDGSDDLERDYRHGVGAAMAALPGGGAIDDADFATMRAQVQRLVEALPHHDAPASSDVVRALVSAEFALQEAIAERRDAVRATIAPVPTGDDAPEQVELDAATLTRYLRDTVAGAGAATVRHTRVIAGGRSKQTMLAELDRPVGDLPQCFIVRKDRDGGIVDSTAADEFEILRVIDATPGIPAPQPLWVEHDPAQLGGSCMAVSLLPGSLEGEYHLDVRKPARHHRALATQMARILAHIHAIPTSRFVRTALDAEPDLRERLAARTRAMAAQFAQAEGQASVAAAIALRWLEDHADWGLIAAPRFIHGDFGLHNLLIHDGEITGVLDWEFAGIASPANDIAMCYRLTSHLDIVWDDFVAAYREAGGSADACDPRCVAFYRVLGLASGTVRSRYGGHLFRTGQRSDLIVANSGYDYHFRSSRLLAEVLRDALALV